MSKPHTDTTYLTRRELLRFGSLAAAGSFAARFQPAMAGPFEGADFEKLVPSDKRLTAVWLRSLTERGDPAWFTGEDLKHIGMPVGGICCGQVYLSGDGRLWHWDILAYQPGGIVGYRGEEVSYEAIDGQCGTILRVYREHMMSANEEFLKRIWPRVKESIQ